MSDGSAIEWTDATWNPVTGCSKVSPGCAHCYAETLSRRFGWTPESWTPANAALNVRMRPERLEQPLGWREPRMVFVNSMADLFHELVPFEYVDRVFTVMAATPRHTYQILTKRPERMKSFASRWLRTHREPLPNVWLGVSIENDRWAGRAELLRETPAAVRFISAEPLLGPLQDLDLSRIDWLIVGGESGPRHRPIDPEWPRDLRDRAIAAGVAFFFKQWGGRTPKSGGRLLDGREWSEIPARVPATTTRRGALGRSPRRPSPSARSPVLADAG